MGHENLIKDLKWLLAEAESGAFGDFTNEKYPLPKRALVEALEVMKVNVINGKYDN